MQIDVVFAWVDKTDATLREKFEEYFRSDAPDSSFGKAYRPDNSSELEVAVKRIIRFGQTIRNIYIVVDDQDPFARFPSLLEFKDRIHVIDHRDIFPDPSVLPCFDSNAIECHFWRIPGLSEFFLYCNDDFFFIDDVKARDLVDAENRIILDVDPFDWSSRIDRPNLLQRHQNLVNTIHVFSRKYEARSFQLARHYPYMYSRRVFEEMYSRFPEEMAIVSNSRFRTDQYILPLALHHWLALELGIGVRNYRDRGVVIYNEAETNRGTPIEQYDDYKTGSLFLCVNNWDKVLATHPAFIERIKKETWQPR